MEWKIEKKIIKEIKWKIVMTEFIPSSCIHTEQQTNHMKYRPG